jgi:hypothetical protein
MSRTSRCAKWTDSFPIEPDLRIQQNQPARPVGIEADAHRQQAPAAVVHGKPERQGECRVVDQLPILVEGRDRESFERRQVYCIPAVARELEEIRLAFDLAQFG